MSKFLNLLFLFCLLCILVFFLQSSLHASEILSEEGICTEDVESPSECTDALNPINNLIIQGIEQKQNKSSQTSKKGPIEEYVKSSKGNSQTEPSHTQIKKEDEKKVKDSLFRLQRETKNVIVYFFWGDGCSHCEKEKIFLNETKKKYPSLKIRDFEVWYDKENARLLTKMAEAYHMKASGVPVTFVGNKAFFGFSEQTKKDIEEHINTCIAVQCIDPVIVLKGKSMIDTTNNEVQKKALLEKTKDVECVEKNKTVYIPWVGNLNAAEMSLPVMTIIIAGLDSFNPCAFFILFSLLGLMIYAQSRGKMLLIGSVFVFFSGFIYFLFMSAWLNLFLLMGQVAIITSIAGVIAIAIAIINIKDYFAFKKGISLTIPESAKPKLFEQMRKLLKSTSLLSILVGTTVLAVTANAYELLCTAGFPMVFTRILTLNHLSTLSYYLYLILYNLVYIIPLAVIVIIFTITLGKKKLTERQGRMLKLLSGIMMLGLGGILLFKPALLNSIFVSLLLLIGALVISTTTVFFTRKLVH